MNPIRFVANYLFRRTLQDRGPALTFARLCTSRHLEDLQWVAFLMILLLLVTLGIALYSFHAPTTSVNSAVTTVNNAVASALAAAAAAVLNWTYQSASRRIGAVDLFACEISVICRVCIVVNFAQLCVERAERQHEIVERGFAAEGGGSTKFTSEEHYTPVYDGQLSDLEPLDVNVVTYVTQFYTYRKTMMDYLRAIAEAKNVSESEILMIQMIYMQFLMYESGRLAVEELIEFEPNKAESLVNILCSELVIYAFLQPRYENDYRGKRLCLRCEQYHKIVPELYNRIMDAQHPNWKKAQTTAPELIERYKKTCSALRLEQPIG
jgi:hypothetical protein